MSNHLKGILMVLSSTAMWGLVGILVQYVKHKRPSGLELISILFAITGTSLIVTKGDFSSIILSPIALMAGITSALCCVFYTLQPRKVLSKYSSTNVMGWSMLFGGIFISCFNNPLDIPREINLYTLSAILSMILFGTVLASLLLLLKKP